MPTKAPWKAFCACCGVLLITRRRAVSCPQCGRECTTSPEHQITWKVARSREKPKNNSQVIIASTSRIRRSGELRSTPVFKRTKSGVEVTVFEVEAANGDVTYATRLTYAYRRATTRKWELSENIPSTVLPFAIKLLDRARDFIERQQRSGALPSVRS